IEPTAIQTRKIKVAPNQTADFRVFVDAWGNPLRYYPFPTGNDDLNDAPYLDLRVNSLGQLMVPPATRDPQDPEGTLYSPLWPAGSRQLVGGARPPPHPERAQEGRREGLPADRPPPNRGGGVVRAGRGVGHRPGDDGADHRRGRRGQHLQLPPAQVRSARGLI